MKNKLVVIISLIAMAFFLPDVATASERLIDLESTIETKDDTWVQNFMDNGVLQVEEAAEKIFQDTFSMDTVEGSISVINNRIVELYKSNVTEGDIAKTLSKLVATCIHNIGGVTYGLYGRYKGEKISPHLIVAHYVNDFLNQRNLHLSEKLETSFKWGNKSLVQYLKDNSIDKDHKNKEQLNNLIHEINITLQSPEIIYSLGKGYEREKKYRGPKMGEAIKYYEMAAKKGDIKSLFELVKIYSFSEFENKIKRDKAISQLKDLSAKKLPEANLYLGQLAESRIDLGENNINYMDVAIKYYKSASMLNNPIASLRLGQIFEGHQDVLNDFNKAVHFYAMAVKQGNVEAVDALKRMSNEGYEQASLTMGKVYSLGSQGIEKDNDQAIKYFKKAIEKGNGEAILELGKMMPNDIDKVVQHLMSFKDERIKNKALLELQGLVSKGTKEDAAMANLYLGELAEKDIDFKDINIEKLHENIKFMAVLKYYETALQLGAAVVPFRLGKIYEKINEIHQDAKVLFGAMVMYAEAAKMGSMEAVDALERTEYTLEGLSEKGNGELSFHLGSFYEADGIKHNIEKAMLYYTKAAIHGNTEALIALAGIYETGKIVQKEPYLAAYYYLIASDQKNNQAARLLNNLYRKYPFNVCKQYGYPESVTNCAPMVLYKYVVNNMLRLKVPGELLALGAVIIGKLYETGDGIPKNINLAVGYYSDAAKRGNQEALLDLERLAQAGNSYASIELAKIKDQDVEYYRIANIKNVDNDKRVDKLLKDRALVIKKDKENPDISDKEVKELNSRMKEFFSVAYSKKLKPFSKVIFYDIPEPIAEKNISSNQSQEEIWQEVEKVIYNNDFYCKGEVCDKCTNCFKGEELFLDSKDISEAQKNIIHSDEKIENYMIDNKIPIGYNIYFPKGEIKDIKGICVRAYGGYQANDKRNGMNQELIMPSSPIDYLDNFLLSQGIAVVKLNLINQLKLDVFQAEMPEGLHAHLHASIDKFFQTLKKEPGKIMQGFEFPKGVKIVLHGASFGGRTVVRHAELYQNTFDGYISHDGALSWNNWINQFTKKSYVETARWLSPMDDTLSFQDLMDKKITDKKISSILNPILILHNYDDNNVPVLESLDFYKRAKLSGKSNLVTLFITKRGNPFPEEYEDIHNKGHYITWDTEAFQSYAATIASFVLQGPSKFPQTTEWMFRQYEILANRNNPNAQLEEKFISEAYRLYIDFLNKKESKPYSFEEEWKNRYALLYALLAYMDMLKRDDADLKKEIQFLQNASDENIKNAIIHQLPKFKEYIQELYGLFLPIEITGAEFASGQVSEFRRMLEDSSNDPNFAIYLIYCLYLGNSDLLQTKINQLVFEKKYAEIYNFLKAEDVLRAKDNLRLRIQEHMNFLKSRSGTEEIREQALKTGML